MRAVVRAREAQSCWLQAEELYEGCRYMDRMQRVLKTTLALLAVSIACLIAPVAGQAKYQVGISDQHAQTFSQPLFQQLGLRYARLVVPWDALRVKFDRESVESWLGTAQAENVRPLISFSHSRVHPRKLPSARQFKGEFKAFRKQFPWIRDYSPWNEANHKSQPTYRKPKSAARYYNIVRASCRGCTIVAADLLDQAGMTKYARAFRRYAKGHPKIWGLHNYRDTNHFRNRGTKELLRTVRGSVWLTETGGIVRFASSLPYSESRAARATKYMFRLARSSRRIKRLYIYAWWGEKRGARFDAGLVGPDGLPRPAFYVVKKKLGR
jgi:hypothetical protein